MAKVGRRVELPKEPCEAVKLLIKRMDSNPQEFHLKRGGMWSDVLSLCRQRMFGSEEDKQHLVVLSDAEVEMVWNKFVEIGKTQLHHEFMRRILRAGETEDEDGND
jgi:hypothetical protein